MVVSKSHSMSKAKMSAQGTITMADDLFQGPFGNAAPLDGEIINGSKSAPIDVFFEGDGGMRQSGTVRVSLDTAPLGLHDQLAQHAVDGVKPVHHAAPQVQGPEILAQRRGSCALFLQGGVDSGAPIHTCSSTSVSC